VKVQPPAREKETRELIERFKAKRKRRRTRQIAYASLGGVVVVALIIAVAVLLTRQPGQDAGAAAASRQSTSSTGVSSSVAAGGVTTSTTHPTTSTSRSTTTTRPTTTTTMVSTTLPATTIPPTTLPSTTSTSRTTVATAKPAGELVVCIDPGHQAHGDSSLEPVGPGSSDMKAKVSDGTAGVSTGTPESELVLAVSLKLRDALTSRGIKVVMTRTSQDVRLSNIERAQIANQAHADLFVRIHADGSEDHSVSGIHVLYPPSIKGWTDDIAAASKQAALLAQRELIAATGAKDRGTDARSDMTGFNWSDVPVILPEIGFMSNTAEDKLLATPAYQDKIVAGLTRAILAFLGAG
jgi:N-acetylmuramoyl-L-alanine amidase